MAITSQSIRSSHSLLSSSSKSPVKKRKKLPAESFVFPKLPAASPKSPSVLLKLPKLFFGEVLTFCSENQRRMLLALSKKYESFISDACIFALTKENGLPEAYGFYHETLRSPQSFPSSKDFLALNKALKNPIINEIKSCEEIEKDFFIKKRRVYRTKLSDNESISRLVIRTTFLNRSSFRLKPSELYSDLLSGGGDPTRLNEWIAYKVKQGFYAASVIGGRRFYVIGEDHNGDIDGQLRLYATRACVDSSFTVFREGIGASDSQAYDEKQHLNLPDSAKLYGIEDPYFLSSCFQGWGIVNLMQWWPSFLVTDCYQFLASLLYSEKGRDFLFKAFDTTRKNYPHNQLVPWLEQAIDWTQEVLCPGLTQEEAIALLKGYESDVPAFMRELGLAFKEDPSMFTHDELDILTQYLDTPTKSLAIKMAQMFMDKREKVFATNILKRTFNIAIIIVGAAHMWKVFNLLQQHAAIKAEGT